MAEEASSPHEAERGDTQCQRYDYPGIGEQLDACHLETGEIIHSTLDYPGNEKLQQVNEQQGTDPDGKAG
jgi:hypothetical protein